MLCVANELGPVGGKRGGALEDRRGQHTISLSAAVSGGGGGDDEADTRVDKDEEGGLKRRQLTGTSPTSYSDPWQAPSYLPVLLCSRASYYLRAHVIHHTPSSPAPIKAQIQRCAWW